MQNIRILNDVMKVENQRYVSFGDYSVTDLISPPRLTALRKRYNDVVERTPDGSVGALIGTAIHELFERNLKIISVYNPKYVLERTVQDIIEVGPSDIPQKLLITGRFDVLYDQKEMTDIKTCSTWKKIFDPKFEDWTLQQNLYAYLLSQRGVYINKINILAIYKDWSVGQAARDRSYPQAQVVEYELPLWNFDESRSILYRLANDHYACENIPDDELPPCPEKDTWARFPGGGSKQYAIMTSVKAKRADKIFGSNIDEVFDYVKERQLGRIPRKKPLPKGAFIEVRHAQRKRCETYCIFNKFCNHYKEYMKKKETNNLNDVISLEAVL